MNRTLLVALSFVSLTACLNIGDARNGAAQRACQYEQRCGNIGSGQSFTTLQDCLTRRNSDFLGSWPTDTCDGRVNGDALNICYKAIENTQCNNIIDAFATATKCTAGDICSGGSNPRAGCNCSNGQTCCNNACVDLSKDRNNCGTCGSSCGSGASCESGACR